MNIERLFELAGLPNNDLLLEAAYDNMVTAMKQKFPEQSSVIDDNIKTAKKILTAPNKQSPSGDKMVWYIKILRAYLLNDIKSVEGSYNFKDMESFNNDFFHYYGYNLQQIFDTELTNQNISELFQKFDTIVQTYQKSDKAPVPVLKGDYELIHFPDGSGWWFIDRGFCAEEGRSGKHCGNVVGKHDTTQRILSLRTPNHNVILTFILLPNGFLGEMKAKANLKPKEPFHPQIMQLLLNPIVKGIKGAGYAPWMNFSIFDLSEQNIQVLINHGKQNLIATQIVSEPIEFLKAPSYIKNNPEYQQIAIQKLPALKHLIGKEKDLAAWEQAVHEKESLIIYAPEELKDYKSLLISHLLYYPEHLLKCPKKISQDYDIISKLLEKEGDNIEYVLPTTPRYEELCKLALQHGASLLKIAEDNRTDELLKYAVTLRPKNLLNISSDVAIYPELCKIAANETGHVLMFVEFKKLSPSQITDLCTDAIKNMPTALEHVPLKYKTYELCKLAVDTEIKNWYGRTSVLKTMVPNRFKERIKQELNIQESLDLQYFQNL